MERLNQYPDLNINQVAVKVGIDYVALRDAQLEFLRNNLKRDNPLWEVSAYGR